MALLQTSSYNPFAALREPLTPVIPPVLNAVAGPSRGAIRTPVELGANYFSNASSVGFDGPTSLTNAGQNVYNFHHSTITSGSLPGTTPPAVPAAANSSSAFHSGQQRIPPDSSARSVGTVTLSGPRQHPSSTYSRLQNEHALGYALYRPQPISSLPAPCREKGVCIGDVGLVTPDGGFDPCFNIYLPADDPVNGGRTPPNFRPMYPSRIPSEDIDEDHDAWRAGDAKYAGSISEQPSSGSSSSSGSFFEGSATEGAILTLPQGGSSYNLRSTNDVFQYLEDHAEEWYDHINKPRSRGGLGRNAVNGSLYAITGVDKTTSWGTGAFSGVKGEGKFPLHFRPANRADPGEARFSHIWDKSSIVATRQGPACETLDDMFSPPENQCIFLRGFKVRLSERSWKSIFNKKKKLEITSILGSGSNIGPSNPKGQRTFSESSGSSRSQAFIRRQGHRSQSSDSESSDDERLVISSIEPIVQQIHPSDAINIHLLKKHPQARLSITHDDTWCAVVAKDGKDALLLPNLLQRVSESNVVHHSHGTVRFEPPDATSSKKQFGSSGTQESASERSQTSVPLAPTRLLLAPTDFLSGGILTDPCHFEDVPSTWLTPLQHATPSYDDNSDQQVLQKSGQGVKKAKARHRRRSALLEDLAQQTRLIGRLMNEPNGQIPQPSRSHYGRDERRNHAARTELDSDTMLNQQLDDTSSDRRRLQWDSGESQKYLDDFRSLILDAAPGFPSLNTTRSITSDNREPVYSGGFGGAFRGEWGGKYLCMKAPRLYTTSHQNEDVGITDYHETAEKRPHVTDGWFPGCHHDVGASYTKDTTRGHANSPFCWTTRGCYQTKSGVMLNSEGSRGSAIGIPPESFNEMQLGNDVNATVHPFSWWEQLVRESRLLMPTHGLSVFNDSLLYLDTLTRMAWSATHGPPHHPLAFPHRPQELLSRLLPDSLPGSALARPYGHTLLPHGQLESSDTIDNVKAKIQDGDGVSSNQWHLECRLILLPPSDLIIDAFSGLETLKSRESVDDQECTHSDGCRLDSQQAKAGS